MLAWEIALWTTDQPSTFFQFFMKLFSGRFFKKSLEAVARRWLFARRTDLCLLRGGRVCPLEGGKLKKTPCSCWVWVPVTSKEWPACGSAATKLLAISPYRLPGWSEACHYVVHSISGSVLNRFARSKKGTHWHDDWVILVYQIHLYTTYISHSTIILPLHLAGLLHFALQFEMLDRYDAFEAGSGTSLWNFVDMLNTCWSASIPSLLSGWWRRLWEWGIWRRGHLLKQQFMFCGFAMVSFGGGNALKFVNIAKDEIPPALTAVAAEAHSEARQKNMQRYTTLGDAMHAYMISKVLIEIESMYEFVWICWTWWFDTTCVYCEPSTWESNSARLRKSQKRWSPFCRRQGSRARLWDGQRKGCL